MLLNPWITPWTAFGVDPLTQFERLERELDRVFSVGREPALDVWTNENDVRVAVRVPGYAPEEVEVSLDGDVLTVQGARPARALAEEDRWHLRERSSEGFTRTLRLPFRVEADEVAARYENGVLWVELPRAHAERPRKITIKNPS